MFLKIISCLWLVACVVLFVSCATKTPQHNALTSLQILIKSPLLRINDAGFANIGKKGISLEIYNLAQPILRLNFNKKFFGDAYYERLIDDIISFAPIFQAKNKSQNNCGGFSQNFKNIRYEVCENKSTFILENVKIVLKKI